MADTYDLLLIGGTVLNPATKTNDKLDVGVKGDRVTAIQANIRGPVLLASGADDRKWPSSMMSGQAIDRLRRHNHPFADEHVSYEAAGHWLPPAYLPVTGLRGDLAGEIGGTPEGAAKAQAQWWPRLLRFLNSIAR